MKQAEHTSRTMKLLICLPALLFFACGGGTSIGIDMEYQNKLNATKRYYPFDRWREAYKDGLEQYTETNCSRARQIFDELIAGLGAIGENASEEKKVALFKTAILATNALNRDCDEALIETGEREELCELTNQITLACGLHPGKYGTGEGLASEWRDW